MENERTENIFTSTRSMSIRLYGCAKFQPNLLFSSQQTATESAAEEQKKKKKVCKPIGDPVGGRDAPISYEMQASIHPSWITFLWNLYSSVKIFNYLISENESWG